MIGFKVKRVEDLWPPVFCDDAPSRRGAARCRFFHSGH